MLCCSINLGWKGYDIAGFSPLHLYVHNTHTLLHFCFFHNSLHLFIFNRSVYINLSVYIFVHLFIHLVCLNNSTIGTLNCNVIHPLNCHMPSLPIHCNAVSQNDSYNMIKTSWQKKEIDGEIQDNNIKDKDGYWWWKT